MKKLFFVISNKLDSNPYAEEEQQQPVVYLIDDDDDDRDIFSIALNRAQIDAVCLTAKNGNEALTDLNDAIKTPNFIFIDLNMPHMSGKECLQEIKKRPMLRDIPAVIYTTSSREQEAEELLEMGAAHYLVKPDSLGKLTRVLKELITGSDMPYYINKTA